MVYMFTYTHFIWTSELFSVPVQLDIDGNILTKFQKHLPSGDNKPTNKKFH